MLVNSSFYNQPGLSKKKRDINVIIGIIIYQQCIYFIYYLTKKVTIVIISQVDQSSSTT